MTKQVTVSSQWYKPVMVSRHRYNVLYGGRSSAKSYTAALKAVILMKSEKDFKGCCLRKIYADVKDSQFATMESIIHEYGLSDEFHITKSPLEITHIPTGNKMLARGLDKAHKLKSINNLTWLWIEEADEIAFEDFIKSDTSVRHPDNNVLLQTMITFNPESEEGWINDYFFPPKYMYEKDDGSHTYIESTVSDTIILHTTFKHNDFCSKGNIEVIERLAKLGLDSNYYRVYVLGLWGNALKGLVFDEVNYVNEFPSREDCKHYGYGLDFGFTNDPTAIVRCALAHGEIYLQELTYKTGLVNTGKDSIVQQFELNQISKNDRIIADSAEPKSIAELCREHYSVIGVKKGKDSIEAGINLMKQYKINIVGDSPNLKKEVKSYKYQENKDGAQNEFSNKPIDAWNHIIDASRYWCWHNLKKSSFFIA
jgi:phage terminase large subunit